MAFSGVSEPVLVALSVAFLLALLYRAGVGPPVHLAIARSSVQPAAVGGLFAVGVAGVGITMLWGTPQLTPSVQFSPRQLSSYAVGVAVYAAGLAGIAIASGRYPEYRQLLAAEPTSVRDCQAGSLVELTGTVIAVSDPLSGPLTDTPCVAYDTRVQTTLTTATSSTIQLLASRRTDCQPFSIDDGTGTLTVDPTGARLDLPVTATSRADAPRSVLKQVCFGSPDTPTHPSNRRIERSLEPGATVTVLGRVVESDGGLTVAAESVSTTVSYKRTVYNAVHHTSRRGIALAVVGIGIMFVTAGLV